MEGQPDILKLLLEKKTNPIDTKDNTGSTPLHWGADEGKPLPTRSFSSHDLFINYIP